MPRYHPYSYSRGSRRLGATREGPVQVDEDPLMDVRRGLARNMRMVRGMPQSHDIQFQFNATGYVLGTPNKVTLKSASDICNVMTTTVATPTEILGEMGEDLEEVANNHYAMAIFLGCPILCPSTHGGEVRNGPFNPLGAAVAQRPSRLPKGWNDAACSHLRYLVKGVKYVVTLWMETNNANRNFKVLVNVCNSANPCYRTPLMVTPGTITNQQREKTRAIYSGSGGLRIHDWREAGTVMRGLYRRNVQTETNAYSNEVVIKGYYKHMKHIRKTKVQAGSDAPTRPTEFQSFSASTRFDNVTPTNRKMLPDDLEHYLHIDLIRENSTQAAINDDQGTVMMKIKTYWDILFFDPEDQDAQQAIDV